MIYTTDGFDQLNSYMICSDLLSERFSKLKKSRLKEGGKFNRAKHYSFLISNKNK